MSINNKNVKKIKILKDLLFPNKSEIINIIINELINETIINNKQLALQLSNYSTNYLPNSLTHELTNDLTNQLIKQPSNYPSNYPSNNQRKLKTPYTSEVPCVICRGLTYCSAINGLMLQEVYYPYDLSLLGSCYVLDAFGKRIYSEIFGKGGTYRDTVECRSIVMQYLCLFYGSNNDMYTNYCIYQEDVSDANPANHRVAPRPPCKSFCVQVATVCANDPVDFLNICNEIACPPTEDACNPDPLVDGETLSANLGCDVPIYSNPYVRASSANRITNYTSIYLAFYICLIVLLIR